MTMMDIETIEHLDFEFTPPCEVRGCDPLEAEYKVVFACCGHTMLWCEECYVAAERYLSEGGLFACELCGTKNINKPFAMVDKL